MEPTSALRDLLRLNTGETIAPGGSESDTMLTDQQIDTILRASETMTHAVIQVWEYKLSEWAGLVDVTDGASSRKFGQLMEHAESMLKYHRGILAAGPGGGRSGRARVGKIIRR